MSNRIAAHGEPCPKHDDWDTPTAWLLNCPRLQYWHDFGGLDQITECQDDRITAPDSNGNSTICKLCLVWGTEELIIR